MMRNAHAVSAAMYSTLLRSDRRLPDGVDGGHGGARAGDGARLPATDLKGVLAQVRANPGKLNFGSPGVGTTQHFAAEYMKQLAGLDIQHVPYRSTPAALTGLIANEVQVVIELIQTVQGQFQAGTLRAIAVTSPERFATVPDIPTFAESGLPGYDVTSWYGTCPGGTLAAIVDRVNKVLATLGERGRARRSGRRAGALLHADELAPHRR